MALRGQTESAGVVMPKGPGLNVWVSIPQGNLRGVRSGGRGLAPAGGALLLRWSGLLLQELALGSRPPLALSLLHMLRHSGNSPRPGHALGRCWCLLRAELWVSASQRPLC